MNNDTLESLLDTAALLNEPPAPKPEPLFSASDAGDDDELTLPADAPPEARLLRDRQRQVLSAIMAGKGYGHAASAGGVSRKTVYNWAKNDPTFKAAMSAWRTRMEMHAKDELTCAVAAAAKTFGRAAATDWRVAALLLRDRGLLAARPQRAAASPLQSQLDALPARRRAIEAHVADLIAGKEPEYTKELRALEDRMVAEEAAAGQVAGERREAKEGEKAAI